jgi:Ca2+/H+ antiporter
MGGAAGAASFWKRSQVTIVSTSLIGAFFLVRGFAFFIGGYTDEITLYTQIKAGTAPYSTTFLAYLAVILILFGLGVTYQTKHDDEPKVVEEDKKEDGFQKV